MSVIDVIAKQRCMSCGMCIAACPVDALKMEYRPKQGLYIPTINNDVCVKCDMCNRVCPALHQEDTSLMGKVTQLLLAHSTNDGVRYGATSGGVVNTLVRYLLKEGKVDAVLMVQHDLDASVESSARWITVNSVSELENESRQFASRYVTVPVLASLDKGLQLYNKIAVVGTSCQMNALESFCGARGISDRIYRIGITCSGGMSYLATEEYRRKYYPGATDMYYRGNGWPGNNTLVGLASSVEYSHLGSPFERMFSSQIFKNPACRYCKDHFAEHADISFCDFWDVRERERESVGNSCVIVRTDNARKTLEEMVAKKWIDVVDYPSEQEVAQTQMRVLKAKKGTLRTMLIYKAFCCICDITRNTRVYRLFGHRAYLLFCKVYARLCSASKL